MKRTFSIILLLIICAISTLYLVNEGIEWKRLLTIDIAIWSLMSTAAICNIISQGLIFKASVRGYGLILPVKAWFGSLNITLFGNYVLPFSGFGFRAFYLKKNFSLEYNDFAVSLIAILVVEQVVFSVFGFFALLFSDVKSIIGDGAQIAFLFIGLGGMLFLYAPVVRLASNIIKFSIASKFLIKWSAYLDCKTQLPSMFLWTIMEVLFFIALFYLALLAIADINSIFAATFMAVVANAGLLFRIAPAGLGTFEGGIVGAGLIFGIDAANSVLVAFLVRLSFMVWFFTLGPIFSWIIMGAIVPTRVGK